MKPLTINDLLNELQKEKVKGHGDYVVFVTNDEEANGYHALWFTGQTAKEIEYRQGKLEREAMEEINCDLSCVNKNKDKAYYLG